jgi:hypothetical protein
VATKNRPKKKKPPRMTAAPETSASLRAALVEQQAALLAAAPEQVDAAQLANAAGDLERHFRGIRQRAQQIQTGKEAQSALAGVVPAAPATALRAGSPVEREFAFFAAPQPVSLTTTTDVTPGEDLGGFFQKVCRAVIDAQKELDSVSLAYALDRKDSPTPGSLYSIPKVTAQVKAGFATTTEQKLNIVLFSESNQISTYGESTISFDVSAAPPAPGALDRVKQPVPGFLLSDDAAKAVFNIVQAAGVPPPFGDPAWQDRAVAFHTSDSAQFPYLVFIPQAPTSPPTPVPTLLVQVAASPVSVQPPNQVNRPELADMVSAVRAWLDANDVQTTRPPHV